MKLNILVPVKRVLDYQLKPVINSARTGIETGPGVKFSINPFDDIALEESLKLQKSLTQIPTHIHAVTIGDHPQGCKDILRNCLAKGANDVTWINTSSLGKKVPDQLSIAKALSQFVKKHDINMVLLGKQAIDDDCGHVGPMLAGLLDWPQLTNASKVVVSDPSTGQIQVTRETEDGDRIFESHWPCVITADLRLNTPRYVSLPKLMKVKRKPIKELDWSKEFADIDTTPQIDTISLTEPNLKKQSVVLGSVDELIARLKNDKVI